MRTTIILLVLIAVPLTASAQVFPPDGTYVPYRCAPNTPMTDGFADEPGSLEERDIVGDVDNAAGFGASDDTDLFLRMRLEEDPTTSSGLRPFSWGVAFDTNGSLDDYEVLVLVSGIGGGQGTVSLFRNTTTTLANNPNDPADEPAVQVYSIAANTRTTMAAGTNIGGTPDFFLSIAIPWADLAPLGLDRDTPVRLWVATSSTANSLNGDFACHDPGADGPIDLGGTPSEPTSGDPLLEPPPPGGTGRLEGGAGCAATNSSTSALWLVLAMIPFTWRSKRRSRALAAATSAT